MKLEINVYTHNRCSCGRIGAPVDIKGLRPVIRSGGVRAGSHFRILSRILRDGENILDADEKAGRSDLKVCQQWIAEIIAQLKILQLEIVTGLQEPRRCLCIVRRIVP